MNVSTPCTTEWVDAETADIRTRLHRLVHRDEVPVAEIIIRSPRSGVYLATDHRVIFMMNERIGYRMGYLPHDDVIGIEHIRQRNTNVVHVLHTSGKLLLTSTDDTAVRQFVAALRRLRRDFQRIDLMPTEDVRTFAGSALVATV